MKIAHLALGMVVAGAALALAPAVGAPAPKAKAKAATPQKADLADQAAGAYFGDVISDARGSSRSDVRIMVAKIGPNRVRITSDYRRLPAFEARLSRYMHTIQNVGGDQVFLLDTSKSPYGLDITVDDASWSGAKQ